MVPQSKLLKPFADYTTLSSGEHYSTISSIIPIIMELLQQNENMAWIKHRGKYIKERDGTKLFKIHMTSHSNHYTLPLLPLLPLIPF